MLQFLGHVVEGAGKLSHFIVLIREVGNTRRVVSVGETFGGIAHLAQRIGQMPRRRVGEHQNDDERDGQRQPIVDFGLRKHPCQQEGSHGGDHNEHRDLHLERGTVANEAPLGIPTMLRAPHSAVVCLVRHEPYASGGSKAYPTPCTVRIVEAPSL